MSALPSLVVSNAYDPAFCPHPPIRQYRPSAWETEWRTKHVLRVQRGVSAKIPRSLQWWTKGCAQMRRNASATHAWLLFAQARRPTRRNANARLASSEPPAPSEEAAQVTSCHALVDACTGHELALVPIEPLVGFLRHPEAHCHHGDPWPYVWSKDYLLPSWRTEAWPRGGPTRSQTSAFFFDLGASLYDKGAGGASTKWFVDQYSSRGIDFDRLYAWESTSHTDAEIYAAMPAVVIDRISYYNLPVDSNAGKKHNPWRTLRAVAAPRDFVVVKIDIDNSPIEETLIAELLADRALAGLVDELYFEHHVHDSPMWRYGWQANTVTNQTLEHSYGLFGKLREMGIRAHSWV